MDAKILRNPVLLGMEFELYYRFTCRKHCTDPIAIPIELKWTKHFLNEDLAKAELEFISDARRIKLLTEYEECIGPVKYVRKPNSGELI